MVLSDIWAKRLVRSLSANCNSFTTVCKVKSLLYIVTLHVICACFIGLQIMVGQGSRVQARGCFTPYTALPAACSRNASITEADDISSYTRYVIWVASRRTNCTSNIEPS